MASEDLLYLMEGLGYDTGVNLEKVARAAAAIGVRLGRPLPSKVHHAILTRLEDATCS